MGTINNTPSKSEITKKTTHHKVSDTVIIMETGKGIASICSQQPGNPQQNFFQFDEFSFDSKFESGNLNFVQRTAPYQYNLWVNPENPEVDVRGSNAWFYFEVYPRDVGPNETQEARFTIKNLPLDLQFSLDIGYRPVYNCIPKNSKWEYLNHHSISYKIHEEFLELTIRYFFTGDDEKVAFAFSFPYTTQTCQNLLDLLENKCEKDPNIHFVRQTITSSLEKRPVECITFTSCGKDKPSLIEHDHDCAHEKCEGDENQDPECYKGKKCILVTCRTNPGETPSSYILEGFIRRILIADDEVSRAALDNFVFVVFPMVNPDGIFRGNMRTDSKGRELSRTFPRASTHHPAPLRIKQIAQKLKDDGILSMTLDLRANYLLEGLTLYSNMYKNVAKDLPIGVFTRIYDIYSKYVVNVQKVLVKSPLLYKESESSYLSHEENKKPEPMIKENQSFFDVIYGFKAFAASTSESAQVRKTLEISKIKKEGCRLYMANYLEMGLAFSIDMNFFSGTQRDNPYMGKDLYTICSEEEEIRGSMRMSKSKQTREDVEIAEAATDVSMRKSGGKHVKAKSHTRMYPKNYEEVGESLVLALVEFEEKHPNSILPQTGFTGMLHLKEFVKRYLIVDNLD